MFSFQVHPPRHKTDGVWSQSKWKTHFSTWDKGLGILLSLPRMGSKPAGRWNVCHTFAQAQLPACETSGRRSSLTKICDYMPGVWSNDVAWLEHYISTGLVRETASHTDLHKVSVCSGEPIPHQTVNLFTKTFDAPMVQTEKQPMIQLNEKAFVFLCFKPKRGLGKLQETSLPQVWLCPLAN